MAHFHEIHLERNLVELPSGERREALSTGVSRLVNHGVIIPVVVSGVKHYVKNPSEIKSMVVAGLLDTGASPTSIDISLAEMLELVPTGYGTAMTAAGEQTTPNFAINVSFRGQELKGFTNIPVGSSKLPFSIKNKKQQRDRVGILIGRDIMSRWSLFWHGPSSSVFISD